MSSTATTPTPTVAPQEKKKEEKKEDVSSVAYGFFMFLFIIIWIWFIAGLLGFIFSIVCFGFNGSIGDKFLGLLIVLAVGPFYWLYFIYNNNYCTTRTLQ